MGKKNKPGLFNRLSNFISSRRGQVFFNFAYSIGAAIVIWGVLFYFLHLPGANVLMAIGLGTEVVMFVLTAFDFPRQGVVVEESERDTPPARIYNEKPSMPVDRDLADRADRATREYCEQAELLTQNMRRLNEIYTNMLSALERTNHTDNK